ncbi:DUF2914 domain-containing protein [Bacteriovorax sp. DB6_IX]|uniref:DUF2914 domain-containing protein n=1 Tax=Bacteriovorax sp. DB6_IX TaxID=1353530 RepID=UPI00038A41A6|nr:DUF2914 domain-containing protein [Bacteriovorax sp. DB6_IX]EQC51647.1 PF11141 family protein [Bacteriovorax sp. DB6_IX]
MEKAFGNLKKYLPVIFFSTGFLFDIFTLGEIDEMSNIIMQLLYIIIAAAILALEYLEIENIKSHHLIQKIFLYRVDIFHFCLGSLLSSYTLFYFKSGSLSNSYFFLIFMAGLLVFNEFQLIKNLGILIRTSLLYLCLLTFMLYLIPLLIGKSGTLIFLCTILLCLAISFGIKRLFVKKSSRVYYFTQYLFIPHVVISLLFTFFYLIKAFPPIPLSLKYIGVFHNVEKENGHYITSENRSKFKFWQNGDQDFLYKENDKVFIFTKIFAPAGFEDRVNIKWQVEIDGAYKTSDIIPLNIKGGRREGYRAFASKQNIRPGNWRVYIETGSGLEIGRIDFHIYTDENESLTMRKEKRI